MDIRAYQSEYRDDMIFMVLQAKDALGRVPTLNEDLLDIPGQYLERGDGFWLALDENDRVIGCVGYSSIEDSSQVWLHRFYVKADCKRQGIGTALYRTAENAIRAAGKTLIRIHLGGKGYEESRLFYAKQGFALTDQDHMEKSLETD